MLRHSVWKLHLTCFRYTNTVDMRIWPAGSLTSRPSYIGKHRVVLYTTSITVRNFTLMLMIVQLHCVDLLQWCLIELLLYVLDQCMQPAMKDFFVVLGHDLTICILGLGSIDL